MRPFPKEIVSRIPPKALDHTGVYSLISGLTTIFVGYTNEGETIGSCLRTAIDDGLIVTHPLSGDHTIIDADLISHVAFAVVPKPRTVARNRPVSDFVTKSENRRFEIPKQNASHDIFTSNAKSIDPRMN